MFYQIELYNYILTNFLGNNAKKKTSNNLLLNNNLVSYIISNHVHCPIYPSIINTCNYSLKGIVVISTPCYRGYCSYPQA
jgi:hypothetical protein